MDKKRIEGRKRGLNNLLHTYQSWLKQITKVLIIIISYCVFIFFLFPDCKVGISLYSIEYRNSTQIENDNRWAFFGRIIFSMRIIAGNQQPSIEYRTETYGIIRLIIFALDNKEILFWTCVCSNLYK